MNQILRYIATYMGFLWEGSRFRLVDSQVTMHNGGDSTLLVESEHLRMRFVTDKTQLFLDLQAVEGPSSTWFSIDLVRRLYRGEPETSAVLDESYAEFVGEHLDDIEQRFSADRKAETYAELNRLKKLRSQEMFG